MLCGMAICLKNVEYRVYGDTVPVFFFERGVLRGEQVQRWKG